MRIVPSCALYIPVQSLETALKWYQEKLGGKVIDPPHEDLSRARALRFGPEEEQTITLGLSDPKIPDTTHPSPHVPVLYSDDLKGAQALLRTRKVEVHPIRVDMQGTKFFEFLDCDGNLLEVSEEP